MFKTTILSIFHVLKWPTISRTLFLQLFSAGIGLWTALLFAPQPAALPPALPATVAQGTDTTPVARWFGAGTARLRVTLTGFITTDPQGAALLAINGAAPQAYRTGQTLAPGVILTAVQANGVLIDQDGTLEHLAAPAKPTAIQGFVPAVSP